MKKVCAKLHFFSRFFYQIPLSPIKIQNEISLLKNSAHTDIFKIFAIIFRFLKTNLYSFFSVEKWGQNVQKKKSSQNTIFCLETREIKSSKIN